MVTGGTYYVKLATNRTPGTIRQKRKSVKMKHKKRTKTKVLNTCLIKDYTMETNKKISRSTVSKLMIHQLLTEVGFKWVCNRCSRTENLIVHHKDNNPLNNLSSNLEIMCWFCHAKIHNSDRQSKRFGCLASNWKDRLILRTCEFCGKEYSKYQYCKHHFCSNECFLKDKHKRAEEFAKQFRTRICEHCNKTFIGKRMSRFCSLKCSYDYRRTDKFKRVPQIEIKCLKCNKPFFIARFKINKRKFCSRKCKTDYSKGKKHKRGVENVI
jgi:hypothetical protein